MDHQDQHHHHNNQYYQYNGENIALQLDKGTYDEQVINDLLLAYDKAYRFYMQTIQTEPPPFESQHQQHRKRLILIKCKSSYNFGKERFRANIGHPGVFIETSLFDEIYDSMRSQQQNRYPIFRGIASNFWSFSNQIGKISGIEEAFSLFMCYVVFDYYDMEKVKELEGTTFSNLKRLAEQYERNKKLHLADVLTGNSDIDRTHLLFSFLFHLYDNYGRIEWLERFCELLNRRSKEASTLVKACNNFAQAASEAATADLGDLFRSWRWPITKSTFTVKRRLSQDIQVPTARIKKVTKMDDKPTYRVEIALKGFTPDSTCRVEGIYDRSSNDGHEYGKWQEEGPKFNSDGKVKWNFIHEGSGIYQYEFEDGNECMATACFRSLRSSGADDTSNYSSVSNE
jgi:hypothetical protein